VATPEFNALVLSEKDFHQWDLLSAFRQRLCRHHLASELHPSWSDTRRQLQLADYLSLFLFGLLNPALRTMQALCAASQLQRVQREVSGRAVSLGSFSEAQHLADPRLLERVFGELVDQIQGPTPADPRLAWKQWFARDSSLFAALPRMSWALYGGGGVGTANNAVRLHLSFHLWDDKPARAQITPGKVCERKTWEQDWEPGAAYVGDRYFSENYQLLGKLRCKGCRYVLRLRKPAVIQVEEELPVSPTERATGVRRQAWVRLGARKAWQSERVRIVWIGMATGEELPLITNIPPEVLTGAEVGLLYRRRWQIECFFRWLKCLLGCRHWLAESPRGVSLQLYLALIAAVLLQLCTGQRPNKRMLELIQMYQLGWATLEELMAGLEREAAKTMRRKRKKA
jgi:hypothetical protein